MRVSHKYKFIFLSNPQSGSSSIRAALNPYSDIISSKEPPYQHHINAIRLKAQFQEMGWDWDKYLKFTTIRNPWSRMVGRYHYGLKNPSSVWHLPAKNARIFGEFINHREVLRVSRSHTIDKFAFGENGEPLLNHILKLEDINTELPKILKKLGIYEKKIPRKNRSSHKHYSFYYDQSTKDKVEKIFAFDIKFGQYVFENKAPAVKKD